MRRALVVIQVLIFAVLILFNQGSRAEESRIICASTTSTQNSGLFDYILPHFQQKTGIRVDVIAVGTGQALAIGKKGDADVILVHDHESEAKFVAEGYGVNWHKVMYNDFVILGPTADPACIKGLGKSGRAFSQIAKNGAVFVSRGDNSGTHKAEMRVWKNAGISPRNEKWYMETGQGMTNTIRIAGEKGGYTLSDRGSWLAAKDKKDLGLAIYVEGDPALFNPYGVIAVNPAKHPHVRYKEAVTFINWLISPDGQALIGSYTDKSGHQLFIPNAR